MAKPKVGDVYLLCSDGLPKMVRDDQEIRDLLRGTPDLDQAVARLIDEANARGGRDNVTVVAVAVQDVASVPPLPLRSR
jgi:protein phosphatase